MKATGIVRRVDELGRIVIPIEIRNKLDLQQKDPVEIYVDGSNIILKKYEPNCTFCSKEGNLIRYKDKLICDSCAKKIFDLTKLNEDQKDEDVVLDKVFLKKNIKDFH